jgi:uncharacterized membrane protein
MKTKTTLFVSLFLIVVVLVSGLLVYSRMPGQVVTHWNAQGQPDGYSSAAVANFLMPGMMVFITLLLVALPHIDPLKKNIEQFRGVYNLTILLINGFMTTIHFVSLAWNLGWKINMNAMVMGLMGLLFAALGSLISKARRNYFFGIRTPWTLASDLVWEKTHQLGARAFQIAGGIMLLGLFFPKAAFPIIMVVVLGATLVPVVYSYIIWRQIEKQTGA